jgi:hypothetical protein
MATKHLVQWTSQIYIVFAALYAIPFAALLPPLPILFVYTMF